MSSDALEWVCRVGLPALVVSSGSRVLAMNRHAEELFGIERGGWLGRLCYEVVGGTDAAGLPFCKEDCVVELQARQKEEMVPVELECQTVAHGKRWLQLISIPWSIEPSDFRVIHLFNDVSRSHQMWEYIQLIAHRFSDLRVSASSRPDSVLTRREFEVLRHLTLDEDPQRIARVLHISPATVRNHVRHILSKLGAHSIQEAVALHLLFDDDATQTTPARPKSARADASSDG